MKIDHFNINRAFTTVICALATLAPIVLGCSEDEDPPLVGTQYSVGDIQGEWEASYALILNLTANSQPPTVDVIDEGGSVDLSIKSNGRFTLTITRPGRALEVSNGSLGFDEQWLAVGFDDAPGDYSYMFISMNQNKDQMTIRGETEYDFNEDGIETIASIDLELDKK